MVQRPKRSSFQFLQHAGVQIRSIWKHILWYLKHTNSLLLKNVKISLFLQYENQLKFDEYEQFKIVNVSSWLFLTLAHK
jgi:hypothetical protein